jgi:hypothetical protein
LPKFVQLHLIVYNCRTDQTLLPEVLQAGAKKNPSVTVEKRCRRRFSAVTQAVVGVDGRAAGN